MKKRLYLFEFHRSLLDVSIDYTNLSDVDKEKLINFDIYTSFDYDDKIHGYNNYILSSKSEIEKFKELLYNNAIPYICKDISDHIIRNRYDLAEKMKKYVNKSNKMIYNSFFKKINEWIGNNLDLDIVLDIINEKGIKHLRQIDIDYLKKI
jgi:hypothetical protein